MALIFVYNAESGHLNALFDIAHKALSPQTYSCDLCALTHGLFAESAQWRAFRERGDAEMLFLHRDEFERRYSERFHYPVVLRNDGDRLQPLLDREAIARMENTEALIAELEKRITPDAR